jgi:histidinol phosphatase-like enzyme
MFEQACRDLAIEVARSWMIGDAASDSAVAVIHTSGSRGD